MERLDQIDTLQERIRALERENSEMKAAKLMTMFNGTNTSNGGGAASSLLNSLSLARSGSSSNSNNQNPQQIDQLRV